MKKTLFFILFFWAAFASYAQIITAEVDKTVAEVEDEIRLRVNVSGISADVLSPQLPSLPDFNRYDDGFTIATDKQDGVFVLHTTYLYKLIPRFAGKAEIGPITINYLGKEYATRPIFIDVYRKGESAGKPAPRQAAAPAPSARPVVEKKPAPAAKPREKETPELDPGQSYEPIFLLAYTDKRTAYAGEQITLTTSFYNRLKLYSAPFFFPQSFEGLTAEDIGAADTQKVMGGEIYSNNVIRKALFGIKEGSAKIGSARIDYVYEKPHAIIGSFGVSVMEKSSVKSVPVEITVKPLPSGAGEYFYGAVGDKFSISAETDAKEVEAGGALTLTLTVRGVGNLKAVAQPVVPEIKGFKMYNAAGVTNSAAVNGVVQGYKTFKTVLIPVSTGVYAVPPVRFTYFSPSAGAYKTVETEPVPVTVTPATGKSAEAVFSYAQNGGPGAQNLSSDINYIKQNAAVRPFNFLAAVERLGLINLIPACLLLIAFIIKILNSSAVFERPAARAKSKAKNAADAQGLTSALYDFIRQKTGLATGSLTVEAMSAALEKDFKVSSAACAALRDLVTRLNAFKYAPTGAVSPFEFGRLRQDALRLIKSLEKEIK